MIEAAFMKELRSRKISQQTFAGLQDVLIRHFLKTSCILNTSSRCLGDKQNVYWGYLYLTNLNAYIFDLTKSLFNKPISDESKANPKCIN